jgi:hypothetical protein
MLPLASNDAANLDGSDTLSVTPLLGPVRTMTPLAVRIAGALTLSWMMALRPEVGSTTKISPSGVSPAEKLEALLANAM